MKTERRKRKRIKSNSPTLEFSTSTLRYIKRNTGGQVVDAAQDAAHKNAGR